MKFVVGFVLLFLFTSFIQDDIVTLEIKGNPNCLLRKGKYELITKLNNSNRKKHLILSGLGVSLTKIENGWAMYVSPFKEATNVKITASIKNERTNKLELYKTYIYDLCE